MAKTESLRFEATPSSGAVSALFERPDDPCCLLVLAHSAGADMNHTSLVGLAGALVQHGIATFRFQFPYSEQGKRPQDWRDDTH